MTKIFTVTLLSLIAINSLNAGDKFANLTEDYLSNNASLNVRKTIAKDPQTANNVLQLLTKDSNSLVRKYAKENLK